MRPMALALALALAACGGAAPTGGIEGRVLAGPTCPVQRIPPDPGCADRPIAIALEVVSGSGSVVARTESGSDGVFRIAVAPGRYTVRSGAGRPLPALRPTPVEVPATGWVTLELQADTGIR
ncbi:MAG: hypothetical protein Q7S25_03750 [Candidatus Limnocylindria bacterium]|nr:hypothetical protein [Candidatus Limnocylindria bacterium]